MKRHLTVVLMCAVVTACTPDDSPNATAPRKPVALTVVGKYQGGTFIGPTFVNPVRQFGTPAVGIFRGTLGEPGEPSVRQSLGGDPWAASNGDPGWATHAPMTLPREGACIAGIGNRIYVLAGYGPPFGDSQTLQIYDIDNDSWSAGPTALIIRSEGVGVAHGGRLFCIGGRTPGSENAVEIFHPATNTYSLGAPMPTPRRGLAAAVVGKRIFAIGGSNGAAPQSGTPFNVNEVYDISKNSWSVAAPMPTPRMDVVAVTHGGKIYVVGGYNPVACAPVGTCNDLEIYDPAHNTWTVGPPMPTARGSLAVETAGNNLYAIAGVAAFATFTTLNEVYDIDAGTWSAAAPKPTFTAETFGWTHGGRIYVIGGGFFGAGFVPVPGAVNESFRP